MKTFIYFYEKHINIVIGEFLFKFIGNFVIQRVTSLRYNSYSRARYINFEAFRAHKIERY